MARYKTVFPLVDANGMQRTVVQIIGSAPLSKPYVTLQPNGVPYSMFIKNKDLERFAVNILKALGSDKLKNHKR